MLKLTLLFFGLLPTASIAAQKNLSTSGGRFQLIQLSDMRRDQYLLDTQTGRLWTAACAKKSGDECTFTIWDPNIIEGITHDHAAVQKILKQLDSE